MAQDEFIYTYSDDLLYLIDARKTLLTCPFRMESKELCDASFCRLFAVFMVGNLEAMLEYWKAKDNIGVLGKYFAEKATNGERIQSLYEAFVNANIPVDKEVFEDYLAIKYLRNIIVHARWKAYEKEQLEKRGFPTDTRKLNEDHWYRMLEVNQNMMMYIALTGIPQLQKLGKSNKLKIEIEREELKPIILWRKDLPNLILKNFGTIVSEIYSSIEKTANSEKYHWKKGLSAEELNRLSGLERKKLFYIAAKKAGREGFEEISKHKQIIEDSIYFWNLYKQETFSKYNIQSKELENCIEVLMKLHSEKNYPQGPLLWDDKIPRQAKLARLRAYLKDCSELSKNEQSLINALDIGKLTYDFINFILVQLFVIYLPIVDYELAKNFRHEVDFILKAWKLRELWYYFIEKREQPAIPELLFYEKLFDELIDPSDSCHL